MNSWYGSLAASLLFTLIACVPGEGAQHSSVRSVPAFGVALEGYPTTPAMIDQAKASTGLPVRLVQFYSQWPEDPMAEDTFATNLGASLSAIGAAGAVPCVTWEPMSIGEGGRETVISAGRILAGEYDAYIEAYARTVRGFGGLVLVRLAHEMNLERYHWGTDVGAYGPKSPGLYQAMFRHVVDIFRAQGAGNALFVFCPNVDSIPAAAWNRIAAYYPGDSYVDVLGMDGYNWGTTHTKAVHGYDSTFRSFKEIFLPLYEDLRALAPAKPLMVFETSSASSGGDKARWAAEAFETAAAWGLWAVVWFEVDKEQDWPLRKGAVVDPAQGIRPYVTDDPAWLDKLWGRRP